MNATAFPKAALRPMLPDDRPLLTTIFQESIEGLADEDYDEGQRNAWASAADDPQFYERLERSLTLVATMEGSPVGFAVLEGADVLAMLYVHPAVARHGVGSMLFDAVERLATARGAKQLTVEASDNAKPFFDAKGFLSLHRQTVEVGDYWLGNTRMQKTL